MSGNIPYIGSKISLITTSDIRYEGILFTLNREESTIAVQNVRSFGTEGRRYPEVPMSNEIYDFIIFRGKDLKDLTVLQGAPEQAVAAAAATASAGNTRQGGSSVGYSTGGNDYMDSQVQNNPYDSGSSGMYGHQSQMGGQLPSTASDGRSGAMGSSAQAAYQRPSTGSSAAPARNGYSSPACIGGDVGSGVSGGYLSSSASRPPTSAPPDKAYGQAMSPQNRTGYGEQSLQASAQGLYEEGNGVGSSRGGCDGGKGLNGPRPPGATSSQGLGMDASVKSEDRGMGGFGMPGALGGKGAGAEAPLSMAAADAKARGKGKGQGAQKKPLFEVLRFHKRAEELIVKTMKSQNTAQLEPQSLRAMSEGNLAVYHFYLDFVNYCCPSHTALSDEQQWESLSKALKKQFEKDFGSGPGAGQNQKPPQPQRPNNTLGDFMIIESKQSGKKKPVPPPGQPAVIAPKVPAPRGGRGRGAGGRGDPRKESDGSYSGEYDGPGGFEDSAGGSSWACPRCTLRNENILLECAACGTPKQAAALWAEFPPLGG